MDLSWELEQLGRSADPEVVLEGSRLLHGVSDVLRRDDGSMHALVRGEAPQVVTVPRQHYYESQTCTCGEVGRFRRCAHAIAVSLRAMQIYHGLEGSQVARWERYVVARRNLSNAWGGLATSWLESFTCGDEGAAAAVFRDADSLDAHMQIARGLVGKASGEQLSAFLVKLANYHGMDGTSPLGTDGVLAAEELMNGPWHPLDASHPEAGTKMILAVLGSVRRTATVPGADWRLANTLTLAATYLRDLLADGHADPAIVADALLAAELAASASLFPWIALLFERLDREAKPVARAMRDR